MSNRPLPTQSPDAATSHRCTAATGDTAYGLIRCNRFLGHEGQHEAVGYDFAWGPEEPTGKWVGERWVPNVEAR